MTLDSASFLPLATSQVSTQLYTRLSHCSSFVIAAEDALEFAARALRQVSIDSQNWNQLLKENKAYAMGKHGKPLYMPKKCATNHSPPAS